MKLSSRGLYWLPFQQIQRAICVMNANCLKMMRERPVSEKAGRLCLPFLLQSKK